MYKFFKRIIDLIVAFCALVLLLPFFIFVAIVLMFTGEREVLFRQKRLGYKQKEFLVWKFATMLKNSETIGNKSMTLRNDPRVTRVGKVLRITKINELPQLLNVLFGQMSIVGPRPLMKVSFENYSTEHKKRVYNSKPGITGLASILLRDEEKLATDASLNGINPRSFYKDTLYPYKGDLEMWYQDNKSNNVDILIILMTFWVLFFPTTNLPYILFKDLPPRPIELL